MAMRNFWLESSIEGRASNLSGGPRRKKDGMCVTLYQRDKGESVVACKILSYVNYEGLLVTRVQNSEDKIILEFKTER